MQKNFMLGSGFTTVLDCFIIMSTQFKCVGTYNSCTFNMDVLSCLLYIKMKLCFMDQRKLYCSIFNGIYMAN